MHQFLNVFFAYVPRKMRDRLQAMVYVQLRTHQHKPESIYATCQCPNAPRVPCCMFHINQRSKGYSDNDGNHQRTDVCCCKPARSKVIREYKTMKYGNKHL
jgi:hypothetical protein